MKSTAVHFQKLSGRWIAPKSYSAVYVTAHGAGAGMDHPFMKEIAERLATKGIATLRFNFPYMQAGKRRPDSKKVATQAIESAVAWASKKTRKPIFFGGKSFGGRMSSLLEAERPQGTSGLIYLGFPLHPPKKESIERAAHLQDIKCGQLFLQGTRDTLANLSLIKKVVTPMRRAKLKVIEGGDHSFAVLKRSGRTEEEVFEEITLSITDWISKQLK